MMLREKKILALVYRAIALKYFSLWHLINNLTTISGQMHPYK